MSYRIQDWAGNTIESGFNSFEDAEAQLNELLGDEYEAERGEYVIV